MWPSQGCAAFGVSYWGFYWYFVVGMFWDIFGTHRVQSLVYIGTELMWYISGSGFFSEGNTPRPYQDQQSPPPISQWNNPRHPKDQHGWTWQCFIEKNTGICGMVLVWISLISARSIPVPYWILTIHANYLFVLCETKMLPLDVTKRQYIKIFDNIKH